MTAKEAIEILKDDKELYESEICYAGDGTPDGDLIQALDMAINALKKVQDYEAQWTDDMNNPLEPLKLSAALDCELIILKRRIEKNPKDISILDYTVIAALQDCLKRYAGAKGARDNEA